MILSFLSGSPSQTATVLSSQSSNPQDIPLLQSTTNFNTLAATGGDDLVFDNKNEALVSENGPSGTLADIPSASISGQISRYTVHKGDSISSIAKMFGVTTNTIVWANNLTDNTVNVGDVLIILPVSGTVHTVSKGDTLNSIAKKYKADAAEVAGFNSLSLDAKLTEGQQIIIPDGEGTTNISSASLVPTAKRKGNIYEPYLGGSGPTYTGYYIRPVVGGIRTQGLHGWNAVDIGVNIGTPIYAAAAGEVIIARPSGYNGGYGKYVAISHLNGTQTVYGHMSEVLVTPGEIVRQGQVIGLSGNTGHSTGPHLHFEVRGAHNPLAD
jgi:LysM repeat protein